MKIGQIVYVSFGMGSWEVRAQIVRFNANNRVRVEFISARKGFRHTVHSRQISATPHGLKPLPE